ncbi:MAG: hypothetical protein H0X67_05810 [Acidobacteria bacterium]|nr:hypothetical protein [Acidobacteriota bacterium]
MTTTCLRVLLIGLSLAGISACVDPAKERLKASVEPRYDKTTGRLKELAYDANGNGRVETWTEMDGATPLRSRIDMNEDGRIDRWEEYDENGGLARVGFSRAGTGTADAWAYPGADGTLHRIEISSTADERRIDRWEFYEASVTGADGRGALVRAEEDTTGDGRANKWETYEQGAIRAVAFDETGDGRPDRRLTYKGSGVVIVESHPDPTGQFAMRMEVR